MKSNMKLRDFAYTLPEKLIAYYPANNRRDSRLLCLEKGEISHKHFTDLLELLHPNDLLVFNNTRVIPARLHGYKTTGGKVEVLVERIMDCNTVLAHVRASKAPNIGMCLKLEEKLNLEVIDRKNDLFVLKSVEPRSIIEILEEIGHIPLPPYIKREAELSDRERYQTVYAKESGSVAAPTAGLHFDEAMFEELRQKKIDYVFLTLHVGAGTFQSVRVDNIHEHKVHAETIDVSIEVCERVKACRARGGRVIAVGTTSARALEAAASVSGEIAPFVGDTNLFIYPGFTFNVIDVLITNFHLPESSLLILVCAFAGLNAVMAAYREAVLQHYRFYSYGDAMFITKNSLTV